MAASMRTAMEEPSGQVWSWVWEVCTLHSILIVYL